MREVQEIFGEELKRLQLASSLASTRVFLNNLPQDIGPDWWQNLRLGKALPRTEADFEKIFRALKLTATSQEAQGLRERALTARVFFRAAIQKAKPHGSSTNDLIQKVLEPYTSPAFFIHNKGNQHR